MVDSVGIVVDSFWCMVRFCFVRRMVDVYVFVFFNPQADGVKISLIWVKLSLRFETLEHRYTHVWFVLEERLVRSAGELNGCFSVVCSVRRLRRRGWISILLSLFLFSISTILGGG